jgi:hypothetical protein
MTRFSYRADAAARRERICGRFSKKATSRAAMAPAAKLGDSQMMSFMGFS